MSQRSGQPGEANGQGAILLLVLVACVVVAVTAAGLGLRARVSTLGPVWTWAIRVAGVIMAVGGWRILLALRRKSRPESDRRRDPTIEAIVTAASIMVVLALLSLLAPRSRSVSDDQSGVAAATPDTTTGDGSATGRSGRATSGGFGLGAARSGRQSRSTGGAPATLPELTVGAPATGLQRLSRLLLPILLLVAMAIGMRLLLIRNAGSRTIVLRGPPVARDEAAAGLKASLVEVARPGNDPRGQITAAYLRLLEELAEAGATREPQEAPHEHLYRVLGPLGVKPEPMHRLTELYVIAQFSEHPVTEAHRAAAAKSLEVCLESLQPALAAVETRPAAGDDRT